MELFQEAEFWVAVALLIFFGLLAYLGVPKAVLGALDKHGQSIQSELDDARRIHEEAEALLASLKTKRAQAEIEAAEMLANAKAEALRYEAEAKAKLEESLTRRQALAERKIAQAEAQAAADVKAVAADLAVQAAESMLQKRLKGKRSDPLVDRGVEQLASRLR